MDGGRAGERGINLLRKADGSLLKLPHRIEIKPDYGDSIIVKTPGGGGYGRRR
jgi:5-oxoprolinase (ATP-hydrolysing)